MKNMSLSNLFPILAVVLNMAACIVYAFMGDWARFSYWFSCAVVQGSTLFMR